MPSIHPSPKNSHSFSFEGRSSRVSLCWAPIFTWVVFPGGSDSQKWVLKDAQLVLIHVSFRQWSFSLFWEPRWVLEGPSRTPAFWVFLQWGGNLTGSKAKRCLRHFCKDLVETWHAPGNRLLLSPTPLLWAILKRCEATSSSSWSSLAVGGFHGDTPSWTMSCEVRIIHAITPGQRQIPHAMEDPPGESAGESKHFPERFPNFPGTLNREKTSTIESNIEATSSHCSWRTGSKYLQTNQSCWSTPGLSFGVPFLQKAIGRTNYKESSWTQGLLHEC